MSSQDSSHDSPADPRPITEARLLSMVNASGDSFWESDADRRFVHISDNMCRMMGYAREELRGDRVRGVPSSDTACIICLPSLSTSSSVIVVRFQLRRTDQPRMPARHRRAPGCFGPPA